MNKIKYYRGICKMCILCKGNNLKTLKFHIMLHIVDYITRNGCPIKYDGYCGEYIDKLKIKIKIN